MLGVVAVVFDDLGRFDVEGDDEAFLKRGRGKCGFLCMKAVNTGVFGGFGRVLVRNKMNLLRFEMNLWCYSNISSTGEKVFSTHIKRSLSCEKISSTNIKRSLSYEKVSSTNI